MWKTLFLILLAVFVLILICVMTWSYFISRPLFNEHRSELEPLPALASRSEALTFARFGEHLLLVIRVSEDGIEGIDLTELYGSDSTSDPLALFRKAGFDSLSRLTGPVRSCKFEELGLPMELADEHVAAGTNFAEHAEEVMLNDPPFLFPKLAAPTPWNAPVPFTKRLDFEAELGLLPIQLIETAQDELPGFAGILTNDFSDRWTLIRQLKLKRPMGTTGFAAAKGKPGYLPSGYFLLIPRDPALLDRIEIRLFVNDQLRQRFKAGEMILDGGAIVRQSFQDQERTYYKGSQPVSLLPEGGYSTRTLILTGTAGGVVFKPANIWNQRMYLQPGDVIRTEASYLGVLENVVVRE